MVLTPSSMLKLGTPAPAFHLPDTNGETISYSSSKGAKAKLVMFICNHCPYVKHVRLELAAIGRDYKEKSLAIFAINSNDVNKYPADSPDKMRAEVQSAGYTFPYLYDETQDVARAYAAACTPDFFLFDSNDRLVYRGQLDDSRPGNGKPVNGKDLRNAIEQTLQNKKISEEQKASIGCNIKWK